MNTRFDPLHVPLHGLQLIEASAGTGKTWTIAALYLRLVLEGRLAPEQILVVTFTRAATAELRGRIRARLAELAGALEGGPADALCQAMAEALDPAERSDALARVRAAVSGFDAAAIFTIHGFCQRALAEHALLAGLELGNELVADEADLVQAAFDDAFKYTVANGDAAWIDWLVQRRETPDGWRDELWRYLGQPWLEVVAPDAGAVDATQADFDAAWAAARDAWQPGALDDLRGAVAGGLFDGRRLRADWLESSIRRWHDWLAGPSRPEPPEKYEDKALRRLGLIALAEAQKTPFPLPAFAKALDVLLDARAKLLPLRRAQLAAAKARALGQVEAALAANKRRRGVMSFNDLLVDLAAALQGPHGAQLAASLAERYRAALIDEFQDTDALQFDVFERVFVQAAGEAASVFLVGDPKQAIYSFRGADLYAYLNARQQAGQRYTLTTNRRSTPPLVTAVGRLFGLAPSPFLLDELDFAAVDALDDKPVLAVDGRPLPALGWQWLAPQSEAFNKDGATYAASRQAADAIAALLALGRAGRARLGECDVGAGDIAVLAASHRQLEAMQQALRECGVPSVRIGQDSVFATEEAGALLQVLLALAEPNDRHVRGALASHLGGCDAAALLAFDADDRAWEAWLARFRHWHELWQSRGVLVALEDWLLDAGVAARVADWQDGERRLANLLQLFELIGQEARQRVGHAALIGWYRAALAGFGVEADERLLRLESDAARVRLVTIHASKGLQYPIVFCPFLWDGADADALVGADELADDDTLAIAHEDGRAVLDFGSKHRPVRLAQARRERVSEKLRLLYVALTRPESMLCLAWGPVGKAERSALGWLLCRGEPAGHDAAGWRSALDAVLDDAPGAMGWLALPDAPRLDMADRPAPPIQVARLRRSLRWQWQMSSFSSLTAGLHDERPDHDGASVGAEPPLPIVAPRLYLDIAAFPAGPRAGVMLHTLFETWDFARHDPPALHEHCRQLLAAQGFDEGWAEAVARMVDTTLAVPVTPDGAHLAGLAPARKLVELEFTFGLRPFDWQALAQLLADPAHGLAPAFADAAATLDAHVGRGFLKGFMDLACELNGRYWVLDYKSNKLGLSTGDYTEAAVTHAMAKEHYYLQALIYCVALHRYLKWRRPDYDYARHFGGASYLFLRGLDEAAPGQGVWAYAPPLALIEALEALLCDA